MIIIDSHSHLWLRQDTVVDGQAIRTLEGNGSRSLFFGEEVQMLPPFMIDGHNTAEVFLSNMDYAQVGAAVVVQEVIDGNQDAYLAEVQRRYPDRFCCMALGWTLSAARQAKRLGLRGVSIPGHRLPGIDLTTLIPMFHYMEQQQLILSICLADNDSQISQMAEVIEACPGLKVAVAHFGLPTSRSFKQQVMLARLGDNVRIESGGITWLYNAEFYPFPTAVKRIRQAADWVGWERLMWGSDYPRTTTAITYKMSYDFISKSAEISQDEKRLFLGANAHSFYGFGALPHLPHIKNMSE